jgi:hypothetical protein
VRGSGLNGRLILNVKFAPWKGLGPFAFFFFFFFFLRTSVKPRATRSNYKIVDIDRNELEAKAVVIIRLCLGDDIMYHVMDEESLTPVWLKLKSRYMSKLLTNELYLKQQLYGLKMTKNKLQNRHNMINSTG